MTDEIVQASGLCKRFLLENVIDGLTFSVRRCEILALLGENGCGKTTLLKILMGLISQTSGNLLVFGLSHDAHRIELRHRIGYVSDALYAYEWMTIDDIVKFASGVYQNWDHDMCSRLLEEFSLEGNRLLRNLSTGYRSRMALLLAMCHNAELLLLDEATAGLDGRTREISLELVREYSRTRNCAVVMSSHILSDVQSIATTVGVIAKGKFQTYTSYNKFREIMS